ncbi:MAG: hypothetical protein ACK5NB_02305 [Flavobacteriaceae bacterium]
MLKKEIQIVAFENPYPPNYGGAIDVFYKIKALNEIGINVILHAFYSERNDISGLKPYCKTIHLYKRNTRLTKMFSVLPYTVATRCSNALKDNLNKSEAPIVFESLRVAAVLQKHDFKQKTAVRCHNIEHDYNWGLFKSERNWLKKTAFYFEGLKYKYFERVLNKADILLPISNYETIYFKKHYRPKSCFLPVFQENNNITAQKGFGKYALYHGDLSVADNLRVAFFMADVFKSLNVPLIIASSTKAPELIEHIKKHAHISFQLILNNKQLDGLIENAHINTLYSFQRSGTKLKVFNALFKGRHCIVNKNMVDDEAVLSVCTVAETKTDYQNTVIRLFDEKFVLSQKRIEALKKYDTKQNAKKLVGIMF